MNDALGNPIELGRNYGYSQSSNGSVSITIGKAEAMNEDTLKVTIGSVHERSGCYGNIEKDFSKQDRRRSVYACGLFPIETLADQRNRRIEEILND